MASNRITIAENAADPDTWETFECENVIEFLMNNYTVMPENARLYHKSVTLTNDVTPASEADIDKLQELTGDFILVNYPGWSAVPYIVMAVLAVAVILMMPKIPASIANNSDNSSPNNALSDRVNVSRIGGRIPDIYGTVRSTPDLLVQSHKFFDGNQQIEHSFMCIGRGEYRVNAEDIYEDTTQCKTIMGESVEVWPPFVMPGATNQPQIRIGNEIRTKIKNTKRISSVNGQILVPGGITQIAAVLYVGMDHSVKCFGDAIPFFSVGKRYKMLGNLIWFDVSENRFELPISAEYEVLTKTGDTLTFSPEFPNGDNVYPANAEVNITSIEASSNWSQQFIITDINTTEILVNIVALNGIYKDDGTGKVNLPVEFESRITPVDANNQIVGQPIYSKSTIFGQSLNSSLIGQSMRVAVNWHTCYRVEIRRITPKYTGSGVSDEVKIADLYSFSPLYDSSGITQITDFGNVTTIQVLTRVLSGESVIRDRKLNCIVTRKIPLFINNQFTLDNEPSDRAVDVLLATMIDPKIGNLDVNVNSFNRILSEFSSAATYFGSSQILEFGYTFDKSDTSFEEMVNTIMSCIGATAYRRAGHIEVGFECLKDIPTILFNHRNKIPRSETRSVNFGNVGDNDGVEFKYINPIDDSQATIYIPSDKSAVNPKIIESAGVRNIKQATVMANRAYNKIRYQNTTLNFDALQESNITVYGDKILVTDGTRPGCEDGEVIGQSVLELTLSQDRKYVNPVGTTIFLQLSDGTIQAIPCIDGPTKNKVILLQAPRLPLCLDATLYAKTTYVISRDIEESSGLPFIITEKKPKGGMQSEITAVNYDSRYYQNDKDFA